MWNFREMQDVNTKERCQGFGKLVLTKKCTVPIFQILSEL